MLWEGVEAGEGVGVSYTRQCWCSGVGGAEREEAQGESAGRGVQEEGGRKVRQKEGRLSDHSSPASKVMGSLVSLEMGWGHTWFPSH